MLLRCALAFFFISLSAAAMAAPDCYTKAAVPAHEFPFTDPGTIAEVTGIADDGTSCVTIPFLDGEPLIRRKLNAPLGQLYEAYAKAIESRNGAAARKLFAYVRPTPRTFPQWLWLYNEPQSAPMPWGAGMMARILTLLAPKKDELKYLIRHDNNNLPVVSLERAWPVLFLLMGGEIMPADEWTQSKSGGYEIKRLYGWRYPCFSLDSTENNGEKSQPANKYLLRLK